mmetsp:Transcript_1793/g.6366  ORF Transcript_1793/g.6366 Transcript_1793/m.6366 type:complete len:737 (-) Transcript_1793:28-2238(-)
MSQFRSIDELVLRYCRHYNFDISQHRASGHTNIEGESSEGDVVVDGKNVKHAAQLERLTSIHELVCQGDVVSALELVNEICDGKGTEFLGKYPDLAFALSMTQFFWYLDSDAEAISSKQAGTTTPCKWEKDKSQHEADDATKTMKAIEHAKAHLAPLALEASPEAYNHFASSMLALVFDKHEHATPSALKDQRALSSRRAVAEQLVMTLKYSLGMKEDLLSNTLRYLNAIHRKVMSRTKGSHVTEPNAEDTRLRSIDELIASLVPDERSQPALPAGELKIGSSDVSEFDIQNLAQTLSISRQDAVNALRLTVNDVPSAVNNELARISLDHKILRVLIFEYLVFRGIIEDSSGARCAMEIDKASYSQYRHFGAGLNGETSSHILGDGEDSESSRTLRLARDVTTKLRHGNVEDTLKQLHEGLPEVLEANSELHFSLQRHLFVHKLEREGSESALRFARAKLAPLAANSQQQLQTLRGTLMALASPPPYSLPSLPPLDVVALDLHSEILRLKGVSEPAFMTVLRELLCSHRDWFRSQDWADPFESIFGIGQLLRDTFAAGNDTPEAASRSQSTKRNRSPGEGENTSNTEGRPLGSARDPSGIHFPRHLALEGDNADEDDWLSERINTDHSDPDLDELPTLHLRRAQLGAEVHHIPRHFFLGPQHRSRERDSQQPTEGERRRSQTESLVDTDGAQANVPRDETRVLTVMEFLSVSRAEAIAQLQRFGWSVELAVSQMLE